MEKVKIKNLCNILNGYSFKSKEYVDSGIRIIRIKNVQKGFIEDPDPKFYPEDMRFQFKDYILKKDDLLLSLTGNVGRVAKLDANFLPAALNQRVACLRLKTNEVLNNYLYYALLSPKFENDCIASSKGIAQKNMSTEWLKEYEINLYSIAEQQVIVNVLDYVNKNISIKNKQLEKLDLLIKARFVEMFGDVELDSKGFHMQPLGSIADVRSSKRIFEKEYVDNGVPFLRSKEIVELSNNKKISTELYISNDRYDEILKKYEVPNKDDLLITAVGTIGSIWIVDGNFPFYFKDGNIIWIKNINGLNPLFLKEALSKLIVKHKNNMSNGTAYSALTIAGLKMMLIPVPPLDLQNQFSDFVTQVEKIKADVQKSLDKTQMLFDSLMQKYFGG